MMTELQPPFSGSGLAGLVLACSLALAGCAGGGTDTYVQPFRDQSMSMQGAVGTITPGTSRKSDVLAALGPATVVTFDSRYEVWVYRDKPARAAVPGNEFVILFTPDGVVKKTRTRPAYLARN